MSNPAIRDGRPEDGPAAGHLIREAGDRILDALTASRDRTETVSALTELWRRRGNRFSHQHARVYEEEGQPLGLALDYPFVEIARLDSGTVRSLFELIGFRFFFAMLKKPLLAWGLLSSREAEPGDWYLCVLAADPRFRGRGIGTALLEDTEARARGSGARALSLIVAEDNSSARRLYQRFGFRDRGRVRIDGFSSFQMVKEI